MSAVSPALVFAVAAVGSAVLAFVEARRHDERRRLARILASIAAVVALALLGLYRFTEGREPEASETDAVLWTENADPSTPATARHFALPRAAHAPAGAIRIPDAAFIRREHPEITNVRIVGDGLEPFELAHLEGVDVVFEPHERRTAKPSVSFLRYPRQTAVGQQLQVQGSVDGLAPGETVTLSVVAPDAGKTETVVTGAGGEPVPFTLLTAAAAAEGRFLWQVSAVSTTGETLLDETLGIAVVRPALPRVLAIESSPSLDTAHLQRWFGEIGATLISRATIGKDRHRFTSSAEAPVEFGSIDRELLARVDVLMADRVALAGLTSEERDAIRSAVAEDGLGMLVLASDDLPPTLVNDSLFPWQVAKAEDEPSVPGELRTARLQWTGLPSPLEHPVALENVRINLAPGESALVRDTQGRAIVATRQHGRGTMGMSTARDTWRWRLQDQSRTFASYWSYLLGELAKPTAGETRLWSVENASNAPLTVHQPVQLRLSGGEQAPGAVHVTSDSEPEQVALALANDPAEPQHWRSTFWPRRAGWHTVQLAPDGARLDFYVHESHAWQSLAPARRIAATRTAAVRPRTPPTAAGAHENEPAQSSAAATILLYALFLLSSGYLWLERRRAAA